MERPVKKQQQVAQVAQDEIKEEHLLAFIAKEKYEDEQQCKTELEKYCKELKEADENFKVNEKVKEICGKKEEERCTGLKAKVKDELGDFDTDLEASVDDIKDEVCEKYEEKCILLEEAGDDDLKKNSVKLREGCYKLKREKVVEELLFRTLGGDANEVNKCKGKMKDVCPVLSRESDELMSLCLNPTKTCKTMESKLKDVCKTLKKELDQKNLEKDFHKKLEKCHFYEQASTDAKCQDFEKKCKEKNIRYEAPESDLSPVKSKASFLRSIGLDDVHKSAEKDDIIIGKKGVDVPRRLGTDFLQDLLLALSQDENVNESRIER
ncbi:hypothetical protein T552_01383 [Pneumocystis carinii B80]|uniref:Major surface glycoprotein n=2 Tax=Pneumocystis carinii TaxID=4754 RepID=A0A0W4ZM07_PNEC8|nr:hypothetical protein T552_02422 [Pneumocystis carinii B80]XP_018226624.1 hypothetical protein T552_01383 [Pneumocystis carinii B80]CAC42800.1 Major surface glycoprotein fragment [Pneumocystis carinii]KTW27443.1 hypothetical protein T552_02422 [Pneumocystis carinii B80]KTW29431.1 hypothetical protein T552_01383 [Pneumocystis carinii B80]CAH17874.1 Major Surface Glycoprotein (MSG) fragment, putative [Pneumocystis carinii]CAH17880.1 Major Surface Glycoprotein (MSG) fragment, putative [Pneumoc